MDDSNKNLSIILIKTINWYFYIRHSIFTIRNNWHKSEILVFINDTFFIIYVNGVFNKLKNNLRELEAVIVYLSITHVT